MALDVTTDTDALLVTVREAQAWAVTLHVGGTVNDEGKKRIANVLDSLAAELERVKAERDEARRSLWSDRGVMLDMQARLDKSLSALREMANSRMHAGTTTHEPTPEEFYPTYGVLAEQRARAATAEIEGEA